MIKKPKIISDWESSYPHVCWNCETYDKNGVCGKFEETPPADFLETSGACDQWEMDIPFN